MNDSDSSSEEDAFMSAAEELSLSPTPHNYETPTMNSETSGDLKEEIEESKEEKEKDDDLKENLGDKDEIGTGPFDLEVEHGGDAALPARSCHVEVAVTTDNSDDDDEYRDKYSYSSLKMLDRDFFSSPRLIVRGIWRGDGLELQAKRRTEGTLVEWSLKTMKTKHEKEKTLLLVKANMTYKYALGLSRATKKYGYNIDGGYGWSGYGYGYCTLPPLSDTSEKHIDLEENIFWDDGIAHHFSGPNCNQGEGVTCKEVGCAERIWALIVTTFTTIVDNPDSWQLPRAHNLRKEEEKEKLFMSYFAFHNGDHKIMIHREESSKKVAWLTRANERYDDKPDVDRTKLDNKHKYIWETSVPKQRACAEIDPEKGNSDQGGDDQGSLLFPKIEFFIKADTRGWSFL